MDRGRRSEVRGRGKGKAERQLPSVVHLGSEASHLSSGRKGVGTLALKCHQPAKLLLF